MKKDKNLGINPNQLKLVIMSLCCILLIITIIISFNKKEQLSTKDAKFEVEIEENGEFTFDTKEETKTITFQLKNEKKDAQSYNLGLQNIINSLEDFSDLTYDLWLNDNQEVYNEIFPKEDMLILDGAKIEAEEVLNGKITLKYQTEATSKEETKIHGKLFIEED